ncbi:MAG TPA: RNA 2',3'-cyclic phosphodiesterase [Burkholderiales bacterium]
MSAQPGELGRRGLARAGEGAVVARLFFAIWPPQETALALERWARGLEGRQTPAHKIHLTLAFLGAADREKAKAAALRVQAEGFALPLEEARHWAHNKIVWAGPRQLPAGLARLAELLQVELYREAFILERRPFAAHVTLLRKAAAQPLPALPQVEWPVREFHLVGSDLASGSYRPLERFALA